jgi:ferredoxin
MILSKEFYGKISLGKRFWIKRQLAKLAGEKIFKAFKLHKVELPEKPYFYSPRLKGVPKFVGSKEQLSNWKEANLCETICPTKAIKVTAKAIIIDERGCISCQLCVEFAPDGLLETPAQRDPGRHST